jgi:hypothetical protein
MNAKLNICTGLLFSSLALSAGPAGAVSPHSSWFANRINGGTQPVNMASTAGHFCYLRSVGFENTDTDGETATCRVTREAVVWKLEAILNENNDADAFCAAYCYNN